MTTIALQLMGRLPRELLLALVLALVHGLIHVFIMPPWQHYDEPSHVEYAWLIANRGRLPQPGDVDRDMRITFVRSMTRHNFYRDLGAPPDVASPDAPTPHIGYSQLYDPPLYYALIAGPMFMLRHQSIEVQLHAARLVSLILFLLTVLCAWGVAGALASPEHPLRWMLPCSVALLPAFAGIMASVSNDVGTITWFSFFVWGGVRLLKRTTLLNLAWVASSTVLGLFVNATAVLAIPLAGMALLFALLREHWRWLAWATIAAVSAIIIAASFGLGDPRWWYRNAAQDAPLRCEDRECGASVPAGSHAFRFDLAAAGDAPALLQLIAPEDLAQIRGKTVTLGAWMWTTSSNAIQVQTPSVNMSIEGQPGATVTSTSAVTVTVEPAFYAITTTLSITAIQGWLEIQPILDGAQMTIAEKDPSVVSTIYYDGLVLVEGEWSIDQLPQFDVDESLVRWGDQTLTNRVRNASAEQPWVWMQPWAQRLASRIFPEGLPYNFLLSPLDPAGAGWYYDLTSNVLFETFWARFGWGNVSVPVVWFHVLRVFSVISVLATIVTWPIWRRRLKADVVLFIGLVLVIGWGFTIVRGISWLGWAYPPYIPVARYAYPAIVPTMLLLTLGWSASVQRLSTSQIGMRTAWLASVAAAFALVVGSLIRIAGFYGR